jgi:rhamnulose-1-phosphate aldolase
MNISFLLPYLDEIKTIATQLYLKGWAEKNAGNFSIRIPGFPKKLLSFFSKETISLLSNFPLLDNQVFLLKAKGIRFRDLAKNPSLGSGLIYISNRGSCYQYLSLNEIQRQFCPTSELLSHLLLQEYLITNKPTMLSLLHSHPLEIIIFSHLMNIKPAKELNNILLAMHVEIPLLMPQGVGFVPFQEPGSIELAKSSLQALENHSLLVWERHGCLAIGSSILDAFDLMDVINKAASVFIGLSGIGVREENK